MTHIFHVVGWASSARPGSQMTLTSSEPWRLACDPSAHYAAAALHNAGLVKLRHERIGERWVATLMRTTLPWNRDAFRNSLAVIFPMHRQGGPPSMIAPWFSAERCA